MIVDPAEGEFHRLEQRARELGEQLARAPDRKSRRAIRLRLLVEHVRAARRVARIRWRHKSIPW